MIKRPATQLIVKDLAARRGNRIIFAGLDLVVEAGHALTVIGPNGAGKTTLLRCVAGLLPIAHGSVTLSEADDDRTVGEQCHYIGHLNGIKPALTVTENLAFFNGFLNSEAKHAANAAERFGLAALEDIPAGYLSAGQKRRLGLARLLCAPRPLWLLDEPAVSLDAASRTLLADVVADHIRSGGIVIAVTHGPLGWSDATTFDFAEFQSRPQAVTAEDPAEAMFQ